VYRIVGLSAQLEISGDSSTRLFTTATGARSLAAAPLFPACTRV